MSLGRASDPKIWACVLGLWVRPLRDSTLKFTFWNDFSCKLEEHYREADGKASAVVDQAGEYSIDAEDVSIELGEGTKVVDKGDIMPEFSAAPARKIKIPLADLVAGQWKRADFREQRLIDLQNLLAQKKKQQQQQEKKQQQQQEKKQQQQQQPDELKKKEPEKPKKPEELQKALQEQSSPKQQAQQAQQAQTPKKPEEKATAAPAAATAVEVKTDKAGGDAQAKPLIDLPSPSKKPPAGAEQKLKQKDEKVLRRTVQSRATSAHKLIFEIKKGDISRCAEAFRFMAQHSTFFSEFTFFLRFYLSNGIKIKSDFFASSDDDQLLFETNDKLTAWRLAMKSKLGEYTGCGNFASVMRDSIYFLNRKDAAAAAAKLQVSTPAAAKKLIASKPTESFLIRVEWSCYDADEFEATKKSKKQASASDFHAYLIDVPALSDSAHSNKERDAYLVQSLWYHYDSSCSHLNNEQLLRHLEHLAKFDGKTRLPDSRHYYFTSKNFYGVPLSEARPSGVGVKVAELTQVEEEKLRGKDDVINTLDVFTVYSYDATAALQRISSSVAECFDETTLQTKVKYGAGESTWNRILDVIYDVNVESEFAKKAELKRMHSIGNFL